MKKILIALLFIVGLAVSASADKYSVDREDLPQPAQEFLTKYFPKSKVSMVKTDRHLLKKTDYDVKLVNGTKIEFNNAGKWTAVDCKTREVPDGIVMKPIMSYIRKNFPETFVTKISKKNWGYDVVLSDGVELKFNGLGGFKSMKIDD